MDRPADVIRSQAERHGAPAPEGGEGSVDVPDTEGHVVTTPTGTGGRSRRADHSALDAIRAIAAIAVVFAHVAQLFAVRGVEVWWGGSGDAGVHVFFVLSGYLIATSVLRPSAVGTRGYLIRRAARLLPLYYVSILVAVAFVDAGPLLSSAGRRDLAVHLVLLHGLFRDFRYSINGVWWTLTVEWLFYLLMALLAPVLRRPAGAWMAAGGMVLVGLAWRLVVFQTTEVPADAVHLVQQLPGMADLFGAGMLLAAAERAGVLRRLATSAVARSVLFLASGTAVLAMMALYDQRKPVYWQSSFMVVGWPLVLAAGIVGIIAVVVTRWSPAEHAARWSGLAFLGRSSYGIYLFHPFVISTLHAAWSEGSTSIPVHAFVATTLGITVAVAVVAHYAVERPLMSWAQARTRAG